MLYKEFLIENMDLNPFLNDVMIPKLNLEKSFEELIDYISDGEFDELLELGFTLNGFLIVLFKDVLLVKEKIAKKIDDMPTDSL